MIKHLTKVFGACACRQRLRSQPRGSAETGIAIAADSWQEEEEGEDEEDDDDDEEEEEEEEEDGFEMMRRGRADSTTDEDEDAAPTRTGGRSGSSGRGQHGGRRHRPAESMAEVSLLVD